MAALLHRLGLLAARRAKTVVAAWLAVLALAVTSFLSFGGQLTDQISLPDLETTRVTDRLAEELPDVSGGSATAVLRTEDGEAFTDAQQDAVADLAEEVEEVDAVDGVTDPFAAAQDRQEQQDQLSDSRTEIEDSREEISDGRDQIEQGREQLDQGQQELDDAIAQAQQQGYYESMQSQFAQQQEELEAQREELESRAEELDSGAEELADGQDELERGEAMMDLASDVSMVSEDGDVAVLSIGFTEAMAEVGMGDLSEVSDVLTEADLDGVEVLPSGDLDMEMPALFGPTEAIGLMIAAVVLLVMLGTFVGAGLPLVNALIGVGIGVAGALSLSGFVEMMSVTPILGLMLGLAVGIDYALFILHRHRTQLKDGLELRESIALATGTAGNAVLFAGATVIIALLALNVTGIGFLGLMGSIGAACVAVAVLMAITMTPAVLSLVGRHILRRGERRHIGMRRRTEISTAMPTGRAALISVVAVLALAVMAIPVGSMRLGLPDASSDPAESTSYQAYTAMEEAFGEGRNGPLLAVADLSDGLDEAGAQEQQIAIGEALRADDQVAAAVPAAVDDDHEIAAFQVIPEKGPASAEVEQLVHDLRDGVLLDGSDVSDVELSVAGMTAANIDISEVIADALPLYLGLVVGLSLVLMVVVFRSLLLPVLATLGFVGSYAAGLGGVVAVFQWGWMQPVFGITEPGPILTFLPILTAGILFGLAMDYQLFTASGMREAYVHGASPKVAVRRGLHAGRSVVTAAALIMGSVFAGFIFTDDPMVKSIGLGLALGVLLDAFVVRLLLLPALLTLCGRAAWWLPRWLDRMLPDVDVEGAALERRSLDADDEGGSPGSPGSGGSGGSGGPDGPGADDGPRAPGAGPEVGEERWEPEYSGIPALTSSGSASRD
ncbi:MMPL family transporter [Nesterenkonia sp. F]|uniref:MMPL family transporter n=1 Tax=Nesterenkonia sp. F TaxID=795955 RepID=UPI000255D383|nr:MMPL family transporter [Nesterenkonia sp. F]